MTPTPSQRPCPGMPAALAKLLCSSQIRTALLCLKPSQRPCPQICCPTCLRLFPCIRWASRQASASDGATPVPALPRPSGRARQSTWVISGGGPSMLHRCVQLASAGGRATCSASACLSSCGASRRAAHLGQESLWQGISIGCRQFLWTLSPASSSHAPTMGPFDSGATRTRHDPPASVCSRRGQTRVSRASTRCHTRVGR
mmetsp:Transcript_55495/g.110237  ORF Transcript_55495/g.110237 Transcript_55495/m.110237 type:complete len:201 (+) Transcript_55495:55-657(+)